MALLDLVFSFFAVVVAVVRTAMTVEPSLFLWHRGYSHRAVVLEKRRRAHGKTSEISGWCFKLWVRVGFVGKRARMPKCKYMEYIRL
jgi:hypothetical protein